MTRIRERISVGRNGRMMAVELIPEAGSFVNGSHILRLGLSNMES